MDPRFERAWRLTSQQAIVPWVLRFADLPEEATVIEVGAGPGLTAEAFCKRYPGWRYTAAVIRPELMDACRERLAGLEATVVEGTPSALPVPDDSCDLAISIGIWHMLERWDEALAECARVLKPGGWLVLVDLLPSFFRGPLAKLVPPVQPYTLGEMREQLGAAGFARFRIRAAGSLWYRLVAETPTADAPTS